MLQKTITDHLVHYIGIEPTGNDLQQGKTFVFCGQLGSNMMVNLEFESTCLKHSAIAALNDFRNFMGKKYIKKPYLQKSTNKCCDLVLPALVYNKNDLKMTCP